MSRKVKPIVPASKASQSESDLEKRLSKIERRLRFLLRKAGYLPSEVDKEIG